MRLVLDTHPWLAHPCLFQPSPAPSLVSLLPHLHAKPHGLTPPSSSQNETWHNPLPIFEALLDPLPGPGLPCLVDALPLTPIALLRRPVDLRRWTPDLSHP
eukprot:GGOE01054413.1.p1 GENE.GGOE01054413.1~~GGOE01054413.1.p1  ORF type:complete len:101 (+),score=0.38 GGOE01054413.1:69-371(+)